MDDDDQQQKQLQNEQQNNVLNKKNILSSFRKTQKTNRSILSTTAVAKLTSKLRLQQDLTCQQSRTKAKYKLTFTPDYFSKFVLKFQENKDVSFSYQLKKEDSKQKWKVYAEADTLYKQLFQISWKAKPIDGVELSVQNRMKYDNDFDHGVDLKASYKFQLGDTKHNVAIKSKDFSTPELLLSSKMLITPQINFFGDVGFALKGNQWVGKYKTQLEKGQYVGAYSYEQSKHLLTFARDFKPYLVGLQYQVGRQTNWEILFKRKQSSRRELLLAFGNRRCHLYYKASPFRNTEIKLGIYVNSEINQNQYTIPFVKEKGFLPISLYLRFNS